MAIIDMQRRLHEAGRIRIGQKVAMGGGRSRPGKLDTFRFTSGNKAAMDAVASLYGGEVKTWDDGGGKKWEVTTNADVLRVMVPPQEMAFSQWYEVWSGGGCQRRCDGVAQVPSGEACICDPEARDCKPHTRLSVMLSDVPTSGLWRLDTQGWNAGTELSGAFDLGKIIHAATGKAVLPGTLRLEQRESRKPGQQVRQFAVPVLDYDINMTALGGGSDESVPARLQGAQAALTGGLTPVPAGPPPSLRDQLDAVDDAEPKPRNARSAEPVKPTGIKPRQRGLVVEIDDDPDVPPAVPTAAPKPVTVVDAAPAAAGERGVTPKDFLEFFDSLDGQAASDRWKVLREHDWSEGTSAARWAAAQSEQTLATVCNQLAVLMAPAPA